MGGENPSLASLPCLCEAVYVPVVCDSRRKQSDGSRPNPTLSSTAFRNQCACPLCPAGHEHCGFAGPATVARAGDAAAANSRWWSVRPGVDVACKQRAASQLGGSSVDTRPLPARRSGVPASPRTLGGLGSACPRCCCVAPPDILRVHTGAARGQLPCQHEPAPSAARGDASAAPCSHQARNNQRRLPARDPRHQHPGAQRAHHAHRFPHLGSPHLQPAVPPVPGRD